MKLEEIYKNNCNLQKEIQKSVYYYSQNKMVKAAEYENFIVSKFEKLNNKTCIKLQYRA